MGLSLQQNEQYEENIWDSWLLIQGLIRLKKKNFVLPKCVLHAMVLSQASNDYLTDYLFAFDFKCKEELSLG